MTGGSTAAFVTGGVLLVASGVTFGVAALRDSEFDTLAASSTPRAQAEGDLLTLQRQGRQLRTVSVIGVAGAGVAAVTGVALMFLAAQPETPQVSLAVSPGGVWVQGSF